VKREDEPHVDEPAHAFVGLTVTRTGERRATSYRDDAPRDAIEISVRDASAGTVRAMALFAVVWNAFVAVFFWAARDAWPCLTPFIAAGFFVVYMTAVARFNRLSIAVAEGRLRVRHHPLPLVGAFQVACRDVRSVEVEPMPDQENPRVIGHLDLVVTTDRYAHRLNMGARHNGPRAHHVAALLREHVGLTVPQAPQDTLDAAPDTTVHPLADDEAHEHDRPSGAPAKLKQE
jgi:hypothetical protein